MKYTSKSKLKYVLVKNDEESKPFKTIYDIYKASDTYSGVHYAKGGLTDAKYISKRNSIVVDDNGKIVYDKLNGVWLKETAKPVGSIEGPEAMELKTAADWENHLKGGSGSQEVELTPNVIKKGMYGWKGKTYSKGQINGYDWDITTIKVSSGKLVSSIQGGSRSKGDGYESFQFTMFQDPSANLIVTSPKVVNEKRVREQHEQAVEEFKRLVREGRLPEKKYGKGGTFGAGNFAEGGKTDKTNDGVQFIDQDGNKAIIYTFTNKGNVWRVMIMWGKNHIIDVTKRTNNPFGGKIGTWFNSIEEAVNHYKDVNIKSNILFAESVAKEHGYIPKKAKGGTFGAGNFAEGGVIFKKGDKVLLKDGGGQRVAIVVQDGHDAKNRIRVRPEGFPMDMSVPMEEKYSDDKRVYVIRKFAKGGTFGTGNFAEGGKLENISPVLKPKIEAIEKILPKALGESSMTIEFAFQTNTGYAFNMISRTDLPVNRATPKLKKIGVEVERTGEKGRRLITIPRGVFDKMTAIYADGGLIEDLYNQRRLTDIQIRTQLVRILGVDRASDFMARDNNREHGVSALSLLLSAVSKGWLSVDEMDINVFYAAESAADETAELEEIGSSDLNFILKEMLENGGIEMGYEGNRIVRKYSNPEEVNIKDKTHRNGK